MTRTWRRSTREICGENTSERLPNRKVMEIASSLLSLLNRDFPDGSAGSRSRRSFASVVTAAPCVDKKKPGTSPAGGLSQSMMLFIPSPLLTTKGPSSPLRKSFGLTVLEKVRHQRLYAKFGCMIHHCSHIIYQWELNTRVKELFERLWVIRAAIVDAHCGGV